MGRLGLFLVTLALGVSVAVGVARADPSSPKTLTYHLTSCTGGGAPTSFDAVKEPSNAASLHLTSGTGTFVIQEAFDVTTGTLQFTTPGLTHNNVATTTCTLLHHPVTGDKLIVTGVLTPAG